jgi:amino acid transporter/nucleotide-binding universal stress UspA family protein
MSDSNHESNRPQALALLASERPRNLGWFGAAGLLFGDWGTSRLYVLGLAFLVAGRSSFYLIAAMSVLILLVAWAYTQICRIYPEGGGVYTAARHRHPLLGVVGALLLFSDYTITASLSAVEAFHYFGLGEHHAAMVAEADPGDDVRLHSEKHDTVAVKVVEADPVTSQPTEVVKAEPKRGESLWDWRSPGLWAIVSIFLIGALNLLGPKHTAGPAIMAAVGMIAITLLVTIFALPQVKWSEVSVGTLNQPPFDLWQAFVAVVLALSGVEAIANLTGVMKKPVYKTASKSIWLVAAEVAVFNLLLALIMVATSGLGREGHKEDMLAFLAGHYIGPLGEWPVRIVGGILLLSATNTAIGALMSTVYVMSRDNELPGVLQKLNSFGSPWIGCVIAALVPAAVLLFFHDLEKLAHLYAIGIVGAVAINCLLTAFHPRLRRWYRKGPMLAIGVLLVGVWVTLAYTKPHALIFVTIVMVAGLIARQLTRLAAQKRPKPSLLRQAIVEQLTTEALIKPKILLSTAGSARLALPALELAKAHNAALVVCYVREVALSYKVEAETQLTLDSDPAAQALFTDFLDLGHRLGVPIIPMYDTGPNSAELIAETAAINGVDRVLIGSSRRGALHHFIKGSFQRKLESLLPPDIIVQVVSEEEQASGQIEESAASH